MKQYPGRRDHGDPDSRSQQPATGRRFGGGLHGLPEGDVPFDPDYPREPHPPGTADGDLLEEHKDRYRAETDDVPDWREPDAERRHLREHARPDDAAGAATKPASPTPAKGRPKP